MDHFGGSMTCVCHAENGTIQNRAKSPGRVQYDFGNPSTRSAMWLRINCGLTGAMRAI